LISTAFALVVLACCSTSRARADEAAPDAELASKGKSIYAEHCSHCHGFNMVNPGTVTYDLRTFPHGQKERFVNSVIMGKGGIMPPWGDVLSLDDIDALWAYVLTGGHI
jgi:mono/diheme cytochrome c family protein